MIKRIIKISSLFLVLSFLLTGCSFNFPWEENRTPVAVNQDGVEGEVDKDVDEESNKDKDLKTSGELRKFNDLNALKAFITKFKAPAVELEGLFAAPEYGPADSVPTKNLIKSTVSHELPDTVKVSGNYTFTIEKNNVHVVKIAPLGSARAVTSINFSNRPLELAISGNYLAVSGLIYEAGDSEDRKAKSSYLAIYDITNPETPQELRTLTFAGNYVGLRLSNTHAYFLTTNPVELKAGQETLPTVLSSEKTLSETCEIGQECLSTQVYYFNHSYNNFAFLSFAGIDLTDKTSPVNRQLFLLDENYSLYISEANNLYLAKQNYLSNEELELEVKKDEFFENLGEEDRLKIEKLEESSNFVLTENTRREELETIINAHYLSLSESEKKEFEDNKNELTKSKVKRIGSKIETIDLYKFTMLSDKMRYQARGSVNGRFMRNGFLDEENGYLRIATRRGDAWSLLFAGEKKNYSNVYVLNANLIQEGALENIATSANMDTASFMKERVYLATVEKSAPIYVVDLQDDSSPQILGALQVGEFAYYYPVDEKGEKLLAIGRHIALEGGDEESGLKVSIFDFSDLKQPKELSSYVVGDDKSGSIALTDYKSLANILDRKLISLPAYFMDGEALSFSGVLLFTYDQDGKLSLNHRIDHSAGGHFTTNDTWRGYDYFDNSVRRSFIQGNNIFTFSNKYIKVNNLTSGEESAEVILFESPEDEAIEEFENMVPETPAEDINNENDPYIPEEMPAEDLAGMLPPEEMPLPPEEIIEEPVETILTGEGEEQAGEEEQVGEEEQLGEEEYYPGLDQEVILES